MEDRGHVFHRLRGQAGGGHAVVQPLHMDAPDRLEPERPNAGLDVLFDGHLVTAVRQRLHLCGTERLHPGVQPFGDRGLVRRLIGAVVNGPLCGGHLLADLRLRLAIDGFPHGPARSRIAADGEAALPGAVRPLPDGAGAGGRADIALSWH